MNITSDLRCAVTAEIARRRQNFGGDDSRFAAMLGVEPLTIERLTLGEGAEGFSDGDWARLAVRFGVAGGREWVTAQTEVLAYITAQLSFCQQNSVGGIFCDRADIGKSYAARHYAATHPNAIYVDCSQCKTKDQFLRAVAAGFGLPAGGTQRCVYALLVDYLTVADRPLVILDEAGDLIYSAFLEIKALWNATEQSCAWYLIGADGLKRKVQRAIAQQKVGFAEIFSRQGSRFQRVTPLPEREFAEFMARQAALVIRANDPGADLPRMLARVDGSLRRVHTEICKRGTK